MAAVRRTDHGNVKRLSSRAVTIHVMVVSERSRVLLYVVDAGGGHRATANALRAAAEERGAPLELEIVSLQAVLDGLDYTRRLTGRSLEESYNELLRTGRTRFMVPMLRALQWLIGRLHGP
jgi:hypothetical protein